MEALLERKAAVRAALAETGREKKALARKVRHAAKRSQTAWVLTPFLKDAVLIMYAQAGYTADPAAMYLATAARKRSWPYASEQDLSNRCQQAVEDAFLGIGFEGLDEFARLTSLASPTNEEAMKAAVRVVEEWRLA